MVSQIRGVRIDLPSRVDTEPDGRQAQETLVFGRVGMATADTGQRQLHHGASGVTDEPQALHRREPTPCVYLALFDVGRGVGREHRHLGS